MYVYCTAIVSQSNSFREQSQIIFSLFSVSHSDHGVRLLDRRPGLAASFAPASPLPSTVWTCPLPVPVLPFGMRLPGSQFMCSLPTSFPRFDICTHENEAVAVRSVNRDPEQALVFRGLEPRRAERSVMTILLRLRKLISISSSKSTTDLDTAQATSYLAWWPT